MYHKVGYDHISLTQLYQVTDERGNPRPVAFLAYRVNGQYIMEGLASSFLFVMGSLGFVVLDKANGAK